MIKKENQRTEKTSTTTTPTATTTTKARKTQLINQQENKCKRQ